MSQNPGRRMARNLRKATMQPNGVHTQPEVLASVEIVLLANGQVAVKWKNANELMLHGILKKAGDAITANFSKPGPQVEVPTPEERRLIG